MTERPWNRAVDILQPGADEKIKELGEEARNLLAVTIYCLEHGEFAWNVPESKIEIETTRHRLGEACWHNIYTKPKE